MKNKFPECANCSRMDETCSLCHYCDNASHYIPKKQIEVTLIMASTVDGIIAKHKNQKVTWTGKKDRGFFKQITQDSNLVIMGSNTFDTIGKALPNRYNIVLTRKPYSRGRTDNLIFTKKSPQKIMDFIKKNGYRKISIIGGSQINSLFHEYITKIYLTVCPKLFGSGITMFDQKSNFDIDLEYKSMQNLGESAIVLEYDVRRKK